jgi:hypothetical protein
VGLTVGSHFVVFRAIIRVQPESPVWKVHERVIDSVVTYSLSGSGGGK